MSQEKLQFKQGMTDAEKLALAQTMMDSNWDEIADLPDFVNLPMGSFLVDVTRAEAALNKDGTDVVLKVIFEVVDTLELAQFPGVPAADLPAGSAPAPGSLTSYQYHGAIGIAKFKKIFGDTPQKLGAANPTQFIEILASGAVRNLAITTTLRADKEKVDLQADGSTKPKQYSELVTAALIG